MDTDSIVVRGVKPMPDIGLSFFSVADQLVLGTRFVKGYIKTKLTPAKFGRFPLLLGPTNLHIRGIATFGERLLIGHDGLRVRILVARGATLTVGHGVFMNGGVDIEAWHDIRIGNDVMLAPCVSIIDDDRHEIEPGVSTEKGPTVIEDGAWVGRNVIVLPGVTVGHGSVIGANSVVSSNVPPNSFAAGNPARVIRSLDLPQGWSRRYGYEPRRTGESVWSLLRRTRREAPVPTRAEELEWQPS